MATIVSVDADLCIGSLECNRIAAEAFALDDDTGVSVPLPGAGSVDEAVLGRAAQGCPTQAIRLQREDGSLLHGQR